MVVGLGGLEAAAMTYPSSDEAEERPTPINRTWVEVTRHRTQGKGLAYDGEVLDRLVARWSALLE